MKPTVQAPEFYQVGNDYVQAPLSGFFEEEMTYIAPDGSESACDSYQDGIYRQLSKKLTEGECLLNRVHVLALEVLGDHRIQRFLVGHLSDDAGYCLVAGL